MGSALVSESQLATRLLQGWSTIATCHLASEGGLARKWQTPILKVNPSLVFIQLRRRFHFQARKMGFQIEPRCTVDTGALTKMWAQSTAHV